MEPPSPILNFGVNPFPYLFIFRNYLLRFRASAPSFLRKHYDLQNNSVEKRGGEFAKHALHRMSNVFAGNMFLSKINRYEKGLTQGYSADGGSG